MHLKTRVGKNLSFHSSEIVIINVSHVLDTTLANHLVLVLLISHLWISQVALNKVVLMRKEVKQLQSSPFHDSAVKFRGTFSSTHSTSLANMP